MNIATLLFTYNRSYHTELVLTALMENAVRPQKLYIFQDGLNQGSGEEKEWERVNHIIHTVDWCDTEVIVSDCNRGLAEAIVSGINYAFKDNDAVIVLEDDCVPAKNFLGYMYQCLGKYQGYDNVYCVTGYNYPCDIEKDGFDIYGSGRSSSWGWGTWKDKWEIYAKDYELAIKIRQDQELSRRLAVWGNDLENMLVGNINGSTNSWAVFWALNIIARKGICIYPYKSLIKNVGMDGSGVHCGISHRYDVDIDDEVRKYRLPNDICILPQTESAFVSLFGSYTAITEDNGHKENILLYGAGRTFRKNEQQINEKYFINAFVDKSKKGYYAGKKIIKPVEISKNKFDRIVIMIESEKSCIEVVNMLMQQYHIDYKKIIVGTGMSGNFGNIRIVEDGKVKIVK